tara:strand:+ start:213 stop:599 length:387 start_codon:yes stop_codon:yes gene_type:complete
MNLVKLLDLPKISDPRGNLTFLQCPEIIPFDIKRVFLTYDVPGGFTRGGHSYKTQEEVIVALSGSFDVCVLDKEGNAIKYTLSRSYQALYIPAKQWRRLENFSTNSVSLHMSSSVFSENDYIRDMKEI